MQLQTSCGTRTATPTTSAAPCSTCSPRRIRRRSRNRSRGERFTVPMPKGAHFSCVARSSDCPEIHSVEKAGSDLSVQLLLPPQCWDLGCAPLLPRLHSNGILLSHAEPRLRNYKTSWYWQFALKCWGLVYNKSNISFLVVAVAKTLTFLCTSFF